MNETGNILLDNDFIGPAQDGKTFEAPLDGQYTGEEILKHNQTMCSDFLATHGYERAYKWVTSSDGGDYMYITDISGPDIQTSLEQQVGGKHYKNFAIQPVEFIHKNNLGFIVGNIIKYICRYKDKNGIEDLQKAKHYIDILIQLESNNI